VGAVGAVSATTFWVHANKRSRVRQAACIRRPVSWLGVGQLVEDPELDPVSSSMEPGAVSQSLGVGEAGGGGGVHAHRDLGQGPTGNVENLADTR
jgi:hypothetical protein